MPSNVQKWSPWNWFKKEEEQGQPSPALPSIYDPDPFREIHREIDRMFSRAFEGFGFSGASGFGQGLLRPSVDIAESEKDYVISLEVPGVEEKDVKLELSGNILTVSGEKKNEKESKDKNWHCVERSYGSFRRVLSLPDDADRDKVEANFRNGVLTISMPRLALAKPEGTKRIEIKHAA